MALARLRAVQERAAPGGSPSVKATTRVVASALSGLIREGRVLSRSRPSEPVLQKAFLPAPNAGLGLALRRMISFVPTPSALNSTISARQTCFYGALRSCTTALNRRISADETETEPFHREAICRDNSVSFSKHRRGTCSHHNGVERWE